MILALTATRRDRKRPLESCCQPPSCPSRRNKGTTFAPRPPALNRPLSPLPRPPPGPGSRPILFGSPPAFLTATCTCFRNGWDRRLPRGLIRAPRLPTASRPHMKIVALILRHELTILVACAS